MKQGFMLVQVQCQACKFAGVANPNFLRDITEVKTVASQIHKDSGIICVKPLLFLTYLNALVSNEIIQEQPPQPVILTPNGNSH